MFALCDVNAFYASCETVFRPDLWGKPVVVLSNNDGCVIARNAEAKALGVKMGDPWFKQKDLFRRCGVVCFSSNYELYADMSNRVMSTLEELSPRVEIYSIDEAFCDLTGVRNCRDLTDFGREIRATGYNVPILLLVWGSPRPKRWLSLPIMRQKNGSGRRVGWWIYQIWNASVN